MSLIKDLEKDSDSEFETPLRPEEEIDLVAQCVSGNQGAWKKFVDIYGPVVYTAIRYFMRSYRESMPSEAQNIYQELFLDLCSDDYHKLKLYDGKGRLATWLFTVARRKCLSYIRDATRQKRAPLKLSETEILELGRPLFESGEYQDIAEARDAVFHALEKLDNRSRLLIVLFYFEGLSYEEIALVMGNAETSISAMMKKAREEIEKILCK